MCSGQVIGVDDIGFLLTVAPILFQKHAVVMSVSW